MASLLALTLVGCPSGLGPAGPIAQRSETLKPSVGDEIRYLAFQVFERGSDPAIPFDVELIDTPKPKIAEMVHDIVTTIGVRGGRKTRLVFILGPLAFDHTNSEVRQIIDDGFEIALKENVVVGFHIDDAMFWRKRSDLIQDPAQVEWTNFDRTPAQGLFLGWARPPARMVFDSPSLRVEVMRRAQEVIGAHLASHLEVLRSQGGEDLFAGVIAGWESHMGQDIKTRDRVGFHALANAGYGPLHPPSDMGQEVASIVAEFIALWTTGLAQGGVDRSRICTHVASLSEARFRELPVPAGVSYQHVLGAAPSSQRPSVAFVGNSRPGLSTYPVAGVFAQIQKERAKHGNPWWASAEGTNINPGGRPGSSGGSMVTYLARCFNHGVALVTLFGWGIGDRSMPDYPFRTVTEEPASLAAYRKFLSQ